MGQYPPWPAEDEAKLLALVRRKLSASKIAAELGGRYSRNAVIGKCYRLGVQLCGG